MKRILALFLTVFLPVLLSACTQENQITLHIAVPKNDNIQNIDTNYYKLWLEEKSGYNLVFNELSSAYSNDYLKNSIVNKSLQTDIILFQNSENSKPLFTIEEALELSEYFLPLDTYIDMGSNLADIFSDYSEQKWREFLSQDGQLYFFPSVNPSRSAQNGQSLWINTAWLKNLGLDIPSNTEELEKVLTAFKENDPNGNGISDEVAMAGSAESNDLKSHFAIINAYTKFNPNDFGFYLENGELNFSPTEENYRQALIYIQKLYEKNLLHPLQFALDDRGLSALATDPHEILGVFSASHLSDIFTENDSNIFSNYTQIAPIFGLEQNAYTQTAIPNIGAVIMNDSSYKDEAFELLDLMLSEEAFLVANYGEQGEDWYYAENIDIDIYGNQAEIATNKHEIGIIQNKHFSGMGNLFIYPQYIDGVRYPNYDIFYFNGRALLSNEPYFNEESLGLLIPTLQKNSPEIKQKLNEFWAYIESQTTAFIQGEKDPNSDADWAEYLEGFEQFENLFITIESELQP